MFSNKDSATNTELAVDGVAAIVIDDDEEREKLQSLNDWQQNKPSLKNNNSSDISGGVLSGIQQTCSSDSVHKKKSKKKWVQLPLNDVGSSSDCRVSHTQQNQCYARNGYNAGFFNAWKGKKGSELFTKKAVSLESVASGIRENNVKSGNSEKQVNANLKLIEGNNKNSNNVEAQEEELLKKALKESLRTAKEEEEGRKAMLVANMCEDEIIMDSEELSSKDGSVTDNQDCNNLNLKTDNLTSDSRDKYSDNNGGTDAQTFNKRVPRIHRTVSDNIVQPKRMTKVTEGRQFVDKGNFHRRNGNFANNKNGAYNGRTNGFVNRNRWFDNNRKGCNDYKEENYKYIFKNKSRSNGVDEIKNCKIDEKPDNVNVNEENNVPLSNSRVTSNNQSLPNSNHVPISGSSEKILCEPESSVKDFKTTDLKQISNTGSSKLELENSLKHSGKEKCNDLDYLKIKYNVSCSNNTPLSCKSVTIEKLKNGTDTECKISGKINKVYDEKSGEINKVYDENSGNFICDVRKDGFKDCSSNIEKLSDNTISFLNDSEILSNDSKEEVLLNISHDQTVLPLSSHVTSPSTTISSASNSNAISSVWYPVLITNVSHPADYNNVNMIQKQSFGNVPLENSWSEIRKSSNSVPDQHVGDPNVNAIQNRSFENVSCSRFENSKAETNFYSELNGNTHLNNDHNIYSINVNSLQNDSVPSNLLESETNFNCASTHVPDVLGGNVYNQNSNIDSFRDVVYKILKSNENEIVNNIVSKIMSEKLTNQTTLISDSSNVQAPPGFTNSAAGFQTQKSSAGSVSPDQKLLYSSNVQSSCGHFVIHQHQPMVSQLVSSINDNQQHHHQNLPVNAFLQNRIEGPVKDLAMQTTMENLELKELVFNDKKDTNSGYQSTVQQTQIQPAYPLLISQPHMLPLHQQMLPIPQAMQSSQIPLPQLQSFHHVQHIPLTRLQMAHHPHVSQSAVSQLAISSTSPQPHTASIPVVQYVQQHSARIPTDNNQQQCPIMTNRNNEEHMRVSFNYNYNGSNNIINPHYQHPIQTHQNSEGSTNNIHIENNCLVPNSNNETDITVIDNNVTKQVVQMNSDQYHRGNTINHNINHQLLQDSNGGINNNVSSITENNLLHIVSDDTHMTNQILPPQILAGNSYNNNNSSEDINDITTRLQSNICIQQLSSSSSVLKNDINSGVVMINSLPENNTNTQQRSGLVLFTNDSRFIPGNVENPPTVNFPTQSSVLPNQQHFYVNHQNQQHEFLRGPIISRGRDVHSKLLFT
ncbi:uncharacterized protein LOC142331158 isoform X2 [Lycorma delicatula]|uniref:uncharacterized protein LOC142331158 isoform X2 n=1 Tax=Lycorma delicatula TaxID=130591 RepID=UPI003F5132BF